MTSVPVKADRREMILKQLFDILSGMHIEMTTGTIKAGNFARNRNELPADKVPGILLLDADEVWDPRTPELSARGDAKMTPGLVRMTPEIYVTLEVRKPVNKDVGPDLNLARAKIVGAIVNDPLLMQIVGANGQIRYDGCVTDLARNRTMVGQLGLSFTFVYPFVPTEFKDKTD